MAKRKWRPEITSAEAREIYELGYTIRAHWVSPMEGTEYMPAKMGGENLGYFKSARAAYSFIKRHAAQ
jgi:hypothetical protein